MSPFWFWLLAPGGATYLVVKVVRHPGFAICVLLLLLVGGCFVLTQPDKSGKAVHDLFSDSTSASTSAATTPASDSATGSPLPAWECPSGYACFWNGTDGTGSRCKWDVRDPDWSFGIVRCSWSETDDVRSVYNNSLDPMGVAYFRNTNFHGRIGCTEPGQQDNLSGATSVRSHKWITGGCPAR